MPALVRQGTEGSLVAGRYQILERIGQGGMGKVYKVVHAQLGKVFALKLIGEEAAATPEARELVYREARLASSLQHPNIASVGDFGEDGKLGLFMVMELIEGEPLAKLLHRESRLSVKQACEIVLQVAEALHYIHTNDVVHCDIKTENILITEQQGTKRRQLQVKLLDFGLARSLRASRVTSSLSGTPHYVAPERIRGEPPSPSSDIYGLGILFYELLTGKVPWDGHVAQILAGHLDQTPTTPSTLIEGGLDTALETLILHALAKTPAARHKDMAAFLYELRTVMDMLGFGRRARGRGGPRRVVIERTKNERDEMIRGLYEGCRLPLALVAANGLILVANPAFAKFVMGVEVEVEGLTIQSTPLLGCWDAFETDLARAIAGHGVRRILEVDLPSGDVRRLLMWLDPAGSGGNDHAVLGVQPLDV
jgi:serine/threonine-protein kinase